MPFWGHNIQDYTLFLLSPCCRGEAATFVIFFHLSFVSCLFPLFFLLYLSLVSLQTILPSYLGSFSRFLQLLCCSVSDLRHSFFFHYENVSSPLLFFPANQASVTTSSFRSFILLLSILFTPAILPIELLSHTRSLRCCLSELPSPNHNC